MERNLVDLGADELGHVLKFLTYADDIARARLVCHPFKRAAQYAASARAAASPVPLPLKEGEALLHVLRWAEAAVRLRCPLNSAAEKWEAGMVLDADGAVWVRAKEVPPISRSFFDETEWALMESLPATWPDDGSGARLLGTVRILQASGTAGFMLLLTATGDVLTIGDAYHGNAGLGFRKSGPDAYVKELTVIPGFAGRRVVEVSADRHCAAVDEAGGLWTWGEGQYGQLGHGDIEDLGSWDGENPTWEELHSPGDGVVPWSHVRPTRVAALATHFIRTAVAGECHTFAVTRGGELFAWGKGKWGCLGLGDTEDQLLPQLVTALAGRPVLQVCASSHSVVLTEAGEVYTMGYNGNRQLGHGDEDFRLVPTLVESLSLPLTSTQAGTLDVESLEHALSSLDVSTPSDIPDPASRTIAPRVRVVEVAAGKCHTLARAADGRIFAWGQLNSPRDLETQLLPGQIDAASLDASTNPFY